MLRSKRRFAGSLRVAQHGPRDIGGIAVSAAFRLALVLLVVSTGTARAQLATGDLLVTDFNNGVVWRVSPTGAVSAFSPRPGSGPNLLVNPAGIGVTLDRRVYVVDNATGWLVAIDAETGAQRNVPVFAYDFLGAYAESDIGAGPYGFDIDTLGNGWATDNAANTLRRVNLLGDIAIADVLPIALGGTGALGVGAIDSSGTLVVFVAEGNAGWTRVDTLSGLDTNSYPPFTTSGKIWGVDALLTASTGAGIFTQQVPGGGVFGCDPATSGVYGISVLSGPFQPIGLGGLMRCPFSVAARFTSGGSNFELLVGDAGGVLGGDARVVRISGGGTQSLVAALPEGTAPTLPAGIALVPEPAGAAGAAVVALASLARRRRERTRVCAA
jgi:hypothetical protein